MKKLLIAILGIVPVFSAGMAFGNDFSEPFAEVDALSKLTLPPVVLEAEGFKPIGAIKPIYFDALPWKGKPTKVFAWLGIPENAKGKLPAVVLVHGGGGTAFAPWVKLWNDHGYVAISIAVEGQTDVRPPQNPRAWQRHEWAGPARVGIYQDSNEPLADQWIYHAVADTILANSLLRSLPEVDADKVGVMGISWGGVITSTVIGIDPRFAFAIPTYGCGHLADSENQYGRALGNNLLYQKVWDPMLRMNRAKMPVLWFSWPEDEHFPLDCQAASYQAAPGPRMVTLIPGLGHGHGPGWQKPDAYAFAESIVRDGKPWCGQFSVTLKQRIATVGFAATRPLERAVLVSTTDTGFTGKRKWVESPAKLKSTQAGWSAEAPLPEGTTAWFINVQSGEVTASSDFQTHAEKP
ncbi:MAG: acetylxylan esterase [Akkermansiaceae bacterium]